MKAVVYKGPREVAVEQVEDPRIEAPTDATVKITSTAICGSDLHMYEGRTGAEPGMVFGHENLGIVQEVGEGVHGLSEGDRVVMPFNIACGFCRNCLAGRTGFCLTANPGSAGAAYGYVNMGPYRGGQAEYLRVPFADFNCLKLPDGTEHENDFITLADIFCTGYHATEMADVGTGDTVTIMGAGPVGLMAAHSAMIRGASQVFVVDKVNDRLRLAEKIGATPIDYSQTDPVAQIRDATGGEGTDKGIDAVGYQATVPEGEEQPALVLNTLIEAVRPTGWLGVVGLYVTKDPGAPSDEASRGELMFNMGRMFEKGLRMGTGQADVKSYNRQLRDMIIAGRARPGFVVSKELPLDEAPEAYQHFDARDEGYSKVVLKPQQA